MGGTHQLPLHLLSGVPVIELRDEWQETHESQLLEMIRMLTSFGHFEIVLNLSNLCFLPGQETEWRERVRRLCAAVTRKVRLELVCPAGRKTSRGAAITEWSTSEEQAVCRLKRVWLAPTGIRSTARLRDSLHATGA